MPRWENEFAWRSIIRILRVSSFLQFRYFGLLELSLVSFGKKATLIRFFD